MLQKLHLRKSVFCSAFGFSNIVFIISSHFIVVPYLILWMLNFFQYHQGVKQFGSRSGPTFCRTWSWSKLFAKVISRWPKSPRTGKELNKELLLDITFWLKRWLKSISFGSNFYHLAKMLATTNSEPGIALTLRTIRSMVWILWKLFPSGLQVCLTRS